MSTDTNKTNTAAPNETTEQSSTEMSAHTAEDQNSNLPGQIDDPPPPARVAPSVAQTAWDEEEDLEPGDDIGNRINGPAHHERTVTASETPEAAAKKKRRNRNKKKGAEGEGDKPAEGVEAAASPAAARKPQRSRPPQNPARERPAFRTGEEVFGKVIRILDDAIFVDLSGKAEAIFDRHELTPETMPQLGDHFVGLVHGDGSRGGMVVLSKSADRVELSKPKVEAAAASGELVDGLVTGVIKGGVEVDLDGLRAFAPGSHVDLKLGADLGYLVGKRLLFKVMKYGKSGREVVVSRREMLEAEATATRKEALSQLETGAVVKAVVRSVVEWGVFVAIPSANNIEGLVHVTEATHDRGAKLNDQFHVGEEIDVKVLRIDDNGKLWLSRKAVAADPWESVAAQFALGTSHKAKVARMQDFGVFVELAPGVDGLIRTSDLSVKRINHPSEAVNVGDELEVLVVHIDAAHHKIGLHPVLSTEDGEPAQRIALHKIVKVAVVSTEEAGLLVRILGATGGAARGFIPAGQTGTVRGTDLKREFPAGMPLEAKIIDLDLRRGECKLSVRALKEDSEKAAFSEYRAKVARESKFGTLGDLLAKRNNS